MIIKNGLAAFLASPLPFLLDIGVKGPVLQIHTPGVDDVGNRDVLKTFLLGAEHAREFRARTKLKMHDGLGAEPAFFPQVIPGEQRLFLRETSVVKLGVKINLDRGYLFGFRRCRADLFLVHYPAMLDGVLKCFDRATMRGAVKTFPLPTVLDVILDDAEAGPGLPTDGTI